MRIFDCKLYQVDQRIIGENPFPLRRAPEMVHRCPNFLRNLMKHGRYSPVTGRIERLRCCFLANGVVATSLPAIERFQRSLNDSGKGERKCPAKKRTGSRGR